MSEKEKTISSLVLRLALTGFATGVALAAVAVFRTGGAGSLVDAFQGFYWVLSLVLSVQLVVLFVRRWQTWQDLLNVDASETIGLLIGSSMFGTLLAMAVSLIPIASFGYAFRKLGPWEILPDIYASLAWREFGIVMVITTATACILATRLYQSRGE